MSDPHMPTDLKTLYANEFGISFSDNDCLIKFAVSGPPRTAQAQIGLTHRSAKMLWKTLQRIIEDHEKTTGQTVAFDPEKLEKSMSSREDVTDPSD